MKVIILILISTSVFSLSLDPTITACVYIALLCLSDLHMIRVILSHSNLQGNAIMALQIAAWTSCVKHGQLKAFQLCPYSGESLAMLAL